MTTPKVPGRLLAWTALVVALGASVAANVAFARPELGPRLSASTAPVLTVLAAGLMERVPLAQARRWQRWLAWLGLSAVAGAAFITSYEHQYALLLAYGNPELSAVLLPIAVDGLIVLASVCLAVIAERRRALSAMADTGAADVAEPVPAAVEMPTTAERGEFPHVDERMVSAPRPARGTPRGKRYAPSVADKVTAYAAKHPDATPAVIAKRIGVSERTVRRHLATLTADTADQMDGSVPSTDVDANQPVSGVPDTDASERVNGAEVPALVEVTP